MCITCGTDTASDVDLVLTSLTNAVCRCCNGRVVSALEGGYRIQGGIVSAFARSVAAHVRALAEGHDQQWDPADAQVPEFDLVPHE